MVSKFLRRFCTQAKKVEAQIKQIEKVDKKPTENVDKKSSEKVKDDKKDPSKKEEIKEIPIKKVNVSLQGANTRAGFAAALLLKQHPLIKKVYMHDTKLNPGVASDLNTIDSSAKVEAFAGDNVSYSLRAADVVVLIETDIKCGSIEKKYELSYLRVKRFAENCNLHCPKAIIVICVEPLYYMTELVQHYFEDTPFYHPSRLLGCITPLQGIYNTISALHLNLDPTSVHIPLLGGPDPDTMVPLVSLMTPEPGLGLMDQITFYKMIRKQADKVVLELNSFKSTMNEGFAIGKICVAIAKGLNNHSDALSSVLARSTQAHPLKYLVSTVKFGAHGIYHNYGIPKLTQFELGEIEKAILRLEERQKKMEKAKKRVGKVFQKCACASC